MDTSNFFSTRRVNLALGSVHSAPLLTTRLVGAFRARTVQQQTRAIEMFLFIRFKFFSSHSPFRSDNLSFYAQSNQIVFFSVSKTKKK